MKKRKFSLLLNIATICLCVCAIAIGVYSARTASLSINGSISFTAANCRVRVLGTVTGANETVSPYQEESNVGKVVTDTATPWNVAVTFNTSNLEDGEIAKPIKIAFKMNNLSVSYGVFAQFDFSEEMQSNLNIDVDFTSSLSGYEVLYSADRLCVLDEDYTIDVTATVTLTPKSNENFTVNLEDDFSINFYKQPTATSTSGEYEYGNLVYAIDSSNSGYVTAKIKSGLDADEVVVPPQIEIDDTIYLVKIKNNIERVADSPFANNSTVTTISLPSTITSIEAFDFSNSTVVNLLIPDSVTSFGLSAFSGCNNLKKIRIPSNINYIYADSAGLSSCASLEYYTSNNAKYLGNNNSHYLLFMGVLSYDITNFEVHTGCKILVGGFTYCTNLTSVTIPNSVVDIFDGVFQECSSLVDVTYQGTKDQWNVIAKDVVFAYYGAGDYTIHCTDGDIAKS